MFYSNDMGGMLARIFSSVNSGFFESIDFYTDFFWLVVSDLGVPQAQIFQVETLCYRSDFICALGVILL